MRVSLDAPKGRNSVADRDDGAPFGELGPKTAVLDEPLAQPIKPLGEDFVRKAGHRLCAQIDLDAGERPGLLDDLDERGPVARGLAKGLVKENDPGDVRPHAVCRAE